MQVINAKSSGVGITFIISMWTDMASELEGPLSMQIMSKYQYQLLSNMMVKDLLPVANGLKVCAVPEPSVVDEEAATEEFPAAADS